MPPPLPRQSRILDHRSVPLASVDSSPNTSSSSTSIATDWEEEDQRTQGRLRKGTRIEDAFGFQNPFSPPPSFLAFDSAQEYLKALILADSKDVERIAALPVAESSDGSEEEEPEALLSIDVWVFEHLRRLSLDLTHWVVSLQKECSRESCPEMRAAEWLFICAAHTSEESQCCAMEYVQHTLDGATALLNSPRYFPSRLNIPPTSLKHFTSIARRLYRIFAHAFFHHREVFDACENETLLYGRFLALTASFDLVSADLLIIPLSHEQEE